MEVGLREFEDADLDLVFGWEQDPAAVAMAAFTRSDPSDRDAFDAHYRRVLGEPTALNRVITWAGEPVGTIASFWLEEQREISYWIDPARWGRGIAGAAVDAFLELETTRPLFARVAAHNGASARVLERAGFTRAGSGQGLAAGLGRVVEEHHYRLEAS